MLRKVIFMLLAVVMVISVWAVSVRPVAAGQQKVTVCHKPGTSAEKTLEIAAPALSAHLAHGDTEGECTGPQSDGCTVVNALVPDPQTVPDFYSFGTIGLEFFPGEVIHADITITISDDSPAAFGSAEVHRSSFGAPLAADYIELYSIPAGGTTETASIDYTVVAGDDAGGARVTASLPGGGSFTVDDVNFSCTPAS